MRKAAHERGAIELLEFVKHGTINDARDHLAHIVLGRKRRRDDAIQLSNIKERFDRLPQRHFGPLHPVQRRHDAPRQRQCMRVILRIVVCDTAAARMRVRPAEFLRRHDFTCGRLHERRSAQEDRALVAHDDRLVGHSGDIGPTGRARSHDDSDLRNARRRHVGLVVENAPEVLAVRKNFGLVRQVGPT